MKTSWSSYQAHIIDGIEVIVSMLLTGSAVAFIFWLFLFKISKSTLMFFVFFISVVVIGYLAYYLSIFVFRRCVEIIETLLYSRNRKLKSLAEFIIEARK